MFFSGQFDFVGQNLHQIRLRLEDVVSVFGAMDADVGQQSVECEAEVFTVWNSLKQELLINYQS